MLVFKKFAILKLRRGKHCARLCASLLFLGAALPVNADVVSFKDGRIEENVKSRVLSSSVVIRYQDGTMQTVPKFQLRSVKIRPVNWPPPELSENSQEAQLAEQIRVADASEKGDTWEPRPDDEKIDPWTSAGYGLIPGYSGHFRTGQPITGYSFAVVEGLLLLNAIDFATGTREYDYVAGFPVDSIFNRDFGSEASNTIARTVTVINWNNVLNTYAFSGGITGRTFFSRQTEPGAQQKVANETAAQTYGILAIVLLLDGASSYFGAESWNEGLWTGEPLKKPVDAVDVGLRSMLFPGLGQLHANQDAKGTVFATVGAGLLLYGLVAEQNLVKAQREYEKTAMESSSVTILEIGGTGTLPRVLLGLRAAISYPARIEVEKYTKQRKQAWLMYGSFWAFNVLDAFLVNTSGPTLTPYILPDQKPGNDLVGTHAGLSLQWRF